MRFPQIVVFDTGGATARSLDSLVARRSRWLLREPHQAPACLDLIRSGGPSVLVMKLGRNVVRELGFLDEAHAEVPDVPIVVVADSDDSALMSLVLELGASYVVQPPEPRDALSAVVESLMAAAINRLGGDAAAASTEGPAA
jgi:DNA-binding NarL/FixJ family response regulator